MVIFQEMAKSEHDFTLLKCLRPTRWTFWTPVIHWVPSLYESALTALEEMASFGSSDTSNKASGLHATFLKGSTVLGPVMAEDLMKDLECLNTYLQLKKLFQAFQNYFRHVRGCGSRQNKHTGQTNRGTLWCLVHKSNCYGSKVLPTAYSYTLYPQTYKALHQSGWPHIHADPQSLHRAQFYTAFNTVNTQFIERFDQDGSHKLQQLENVLLCGDMDKVVDRHPEFNSSLLHIKQAVMLLPIFGKRCQSWEVSLDWRRDD